MKKKVLTYVLISFFYVIPILVGLGYMIWEIVTKIKHHIFHTSEFYIYWIILLMIVATAFVFIILWLLGLSIERIRLWFDQLMKRMNNKDINDQKSV